MRHGSREHRESVDPILDALFEALRPDEDGVGIVPPLDDLAERRTCRQIVSLHRERAEPGASKGRPSPTRRVAVSLAAAALVAAGIILFSGRFSGRSELPTGHSPVAALLATAIESNRAIIPQSRIVLLKGEVTLGDRVAELGARLSPAERIRTGGGQAALALPTGIGVGITEHTSVRVLWDGTAAFGVSLQAGVALFSVDPLQAKAWDGFFVDTPAGTIHVKGTLFSVAVGRDNDVYVQLHRGELLIEVPNGAPQRMTPGPLTRLGGGAPPAPELAARVSGQLQALSCMNVADTFTELAHIACLVNDPSEPFDEDGAIAVVSKGPRQEATGRQLSIKELMDLARTRKTDRQWTRAAEAYLALIRHYPASDEARTARVSLAQLQLRHLGKPRGALRQFVRYLDRPGPLTQEALFGKAEALRALGRQSAEARALRDFLVAFPDGVYAASATARLRALHESDAPN